MNTTDLDSLLVRQPSVAITYMSILSVASVAGTIGNLLVICTIATNSLGKMVGTEFFLNLAISDIIVTALINPFAILGVTEGQQFYDNKFWLCKCLASVCIISCISSLANIALISISRYVYVCHYMRYIRVFTRRNNVILCAATWLLGFSLDLPSHVGWSRHFFDEKAHKCLWDRNYQYSYSLFFVIIGIMFMTFIFVAIVVFYARICLHIGRAKRNLSMNSGSHHNVLMSTLKQAKIMVVIFIAFMLCWAPYILILLTNRDDEYPMEAYLFSSLAAHIHASVNFVLYGLANKRFYEGYRRFGEKYLCCTQETNQYIRIRLCGCRCDSDQDMDSPNITINSQHTCSEHHLEELNIAD